MGLSEKIHENLKAPIQEQSTRHRSQRERSLSVERRITVRRQYTRIGNIDAA
jgi:hypothetical protein